MKRCCFTGHRQFMVTEGIEKRLEDVLFCLIEDGVTEFYAGGALGWDTYCAQKILHMKASGYPQLRLHLVLPCPEKDQTRGWTDMQKAIFRIIRQAADSVEYVSDGYSADCMKKRNQRLVSLADSCICYYNPNRSRSGTGQTVRMAERKGMDVINIFGF